VAWSTADSEAALVGEEAPDAPNPDAPEKSLGEKAKASVRWFLEIFSGMWSSREMLLDNSDKQLFVKITLRELIVYCFFLSVVMFRKMLSGLPDDIRCLSIWILFARVQINWFF
jgi:hypothetical protein